MSTRLASPKGTADILPSEWRLRDRVEEVARRHLLAAGYGRIATPTFEHTEVFARGVGEGTDIVGKEMYTFEDRGGRSLTLRPEGTAGVARAFVQHGLHRERMPLKVWYLEPMFRYERPQAGRMREHWQLGGECFGVVGPLAEAELIGVLAAMYGELGINQTQLHINTIGSGSARESYREALVAYLTPYASELDADSQQRLSVNPLRILDSKVARTQEIVADAPRLADHLTVDDRAAFDALLTCLAELGIDCKVDPLLVRGLDYYTGTVFEFKAQGGGLGAQDTIGAGGRYDRLIGEFGGPVTPAVGFGSGVERLLLAMGDAAAEASLSTQVFVGYAPDAPVSVQADALALAAELRMGGASVETELLGRSLKRQSKHAHGMLRIVVGSDGCEVFAPGVWEPTNARTRAEAIEQALGQLGSIHS